MTEPTPTEPQQQGQEPTQPQQPAQTPPWGTEEQFDANRAWQLLQNTRADLEKAKATPRLTEEQQQQLADYNRLVEAGKSEQQRLEEAAQSSARRAETAEAEALRMRVALTHGITAEDLDLLGSGTEEQITARAQRIVALKGATTTAPVAPPTPNQPNLSPGATPSTPAPAEETAYPAGWLSPTQRARIEQNRGRLNPSSTT